MANNQYDNFIDGNGLLYFWQRLKSVFVTQVSGKGLSTNDYTTDEKTKLSGVESGAEVNIVETIKVNGTAVAVSSKAVNISVPTKVSQLSDAANYALKSDLTNVYVYQGQVNTFADLPATSTVGYVYDVKEDGMNYAWNGTEWDNLGQIFTITALTNAEIDAIMET